MEKQLLRNFSKWKNEQDYIQGFWLKKTNLVHRRMASQRENTLN